MYSVDSLRQLAMKFLERDELANYSFQNDFLRPLVVVMRHSKALEIRELIIRWAGQCSLLWPMQSLGAHAVPWGPCSPLGPMQSLGAHAVPGGPCSPWGPCHSCNPVRGG